MEQHKTKLPPFWLIAAVVLYAAGFAVTARWDLAINTALFSDGNAFSVIWEAFGWYPAFVIVVFYAFLWVARPKQTRKQWQALLGGVVGVAGLAFITYDSIHRLVQRNWVDGFTSPRALVCVAGVAVIGVLLLLAALKLPTRLRPSLTFWAFWGSVYCAANQAVIYPLKTLWQRTRFDDMLSLGSFENFTPWYRPFGFSGSSFPSGHTANAAGVFILIILCDIFPSWNKKRKWVYAGIWFYIVLMAFSRVLIGRHYFSDTLAASGIMAILFFVLRRTKWYKNGLATLHKSTTNTGEPA